MGDRVVRIAGASACEFDSSIAIPQLLASGGEIDYMVFDELAELNVATMAGAGRSVIGIATGEDGFSRSFVEFQVGPHLPALMERGIKLLANAGGPNPRACAEALAEYARSVGVSPRIAYVEGDSLVGRLEEVSRLGLRELASGVPFEEIVASADRVLTLLAYTGAQPFVEALDRGADVVIAGRAADSACALGALIHEFGWSMDDFNRLAAGSVIGHLLECGGQVAGGIFTDWRSVPDWSCPSYPIAECRDDGSAVITKPVGTGGTVSVGTVAEQLLYEVGDPQGYILPDVVCDMSAVTLTQAGDDRVLVEGARGRSCTSSYKLQLTFERGWRASVMSPIVGFEAAAKGDRLAASMATHVGGVLERSGMGAWEAWTTSILGSGDALGAHGDPVLRDAAREVVVRMSMDHPRRDAGELFLREQAIANISMAQGVAMPMGHAVQPILRMRSFLIDKRLVQVSVHIDGERIPVTVAHTGERAEQLTLRPEEPVAPDGGESSAVSVPLIALAWGRSGDKGDIGTVAVIARERAYIPYIARALSAQAVAGWMAHQFDGPTPPQVDRYYSPGPGAFSFVLHHALGGGALESPRLDPMGKTLAQQLLAIPVPVPAHIAEHVVHDPHTGVTRG